MSATAVRLQVPLLGNAPKEIVASERTLPSWLETARRLDVSVSHADSVILAPAEVAGVSPLMQALEVFADSETISLCTPARVRS